MRTMNDFTIEVNVTNLVSTLKANRKQHIANYEKAKVAHRKKLEIMLFEKYQQVMDAEELSKKQIEKIIHEIQKLSPPTSYANVYDEVIEMLEMHSLPTIKLDNSQYKAWVKDDWDWTYDFTNNSMSYLNG